METYKKKGGSCTLRDKFLVHKCHFRKWEEAENEKSVCYVI